MIMKPRTSRDKSNPNSFLVWLQTCGLPTITFLLPNMILQDLKVFTVFSTRTGYKLFHSSNWGASHLPRNRRTERSEPRRFERLFAFEALVTQVLLLHLAPPQAPVQKWMMQIPLPQGPRVGHTQMGHTQAAVVNVHKVLFV